MDTTTSQHHYQETTSPTPQQYVLYQKHKFLFYKLKSYIHQLVPTYNNTTLPNTNNKKRTIKQEETQIPISAPPIKKFKTSAYEREKNRKIYHANRTALLEVRRARLRVKHDKGGIIHTLNSNPNLDIDQLIQQTAKKESGTAHNNTNNNKNMDRSPRLQVSTKTTNSTESDITYKTNKRKLELPTKTTQSIQQYFKKNKPNDDEKPP